MGYSQAGYEVLGVDIRPQPRYPFTFVQADALEFLTEVRFGEYDLIHASPPCQAYSRATAWIGDRSQHPDLIALVQALLRKVGTPYVIENVQEARRLLREPVLLCGSHFGLPIQRHRYFEISPSVFFLMSPCSHHPDDFSHDHGKKQTEACYRDAMGCHWMTVQEAREAIPPAYTRWIGQQMQGYRDD